MLDLINRQPVLGAVISFGDMLAVRREIAAQLFGKQALAQPPISVQGIPAGFYFVQEDFGMAYSKSALTMDQQITARND